MRLLPFIKIIVALNLLFLSGCLYSNVKMPFDTNVDKTVLGSKIGKASTYSIAYLVGWGDGGVAAAADNGGIKTITHLDYEIYQVFFGLYNKMTTVAYGD